MPVYQELNLQQMKAQSLHNVVYGFGNLANKPQNPDSKVIRGAEIAS